MILKRKTLDIFNYATVLPCSFANTDMRGRDVRGR